MKRSLSLIRIMIVSASLCSMQAQALICINCASLRQMAKSNYVQLQGYAEEVEQTVNAVKNVEYQVQNLKNLRNLEWGDLRSQLRNLNTIAARGESISYAMANMNQQFEDLFGGTEEYQHQSIATLHSVDSYQRQGQALRDTAQSSLALANQMSQYQVDDNQTLASIQSHAASADGAMQIAQTNAELLVQVSAQLQKLQTLMQTQIQMSATELAADADTVERQRVAEDQMLSQPLNVDATDGKDWSLEWQSPSLRW